MIDKYALQKKMPRRGDGRRHHAALNLQLRAKYGCSESRSTLTIGDRAPSPIHIGGSAKERQCALLRHPSSVIGTNMRPVCRQGLKVCPQCHFKQPPLEVPRASSQTGSKRLPAGFRQAATHGPFTFTQNTASCCMLPRSLPVTHDRCSASAARVCLQIDPRRLRVYPPT